MTLVRPVACCCNCGFQPSLLQPVVVLVVVLLPNHLHRLLLPHSQWYNNHLYEKGPPKGTITQIGTSVPGIVFRAALIGKGANFPNF